MRATTCASAWRSTREGGNETKERKIFDYAETVVFRRAKSEVAGTLIRRPGTCCARYLHS